MNEPSSLWSSGNFHGRNRSAELLFGRMHEDWSIESSLFQPGSKVFCIASAGCTALALAARGHAVDAVDVNPAQVRYVGRILWRRLESGFATHPNRHNPFAWNLLLGCDCPFECPTPPITSPIRISCSDAAAFLKSCPAGSYDAFSLSNILDGVDSEYSRRLEEGVLRAAKPGAVVVLRSLGEPKKQEEHMWAIQDRSLIWGRVSLQRIGATGEFTCFSC